MNKNNIVINKIICTGLAIAIVVNVFNFRPAEAQNNRYVALEKVLDKNPELDLFINEKSQTIDLARTQNIRVRIKAKDLYNSIDRTASFKISVYENKGAERKFISSQQLSIFKGFKRSRVLSISAGEFTSPTKKLEFDIYDTAGNIINTYKTTISAINIESQVSGSTGINIAEANCDGETFGECQIDYLLQRVQFEAKPQRQASTRVVKTNDGLYKVTFPFPRNKFKFLGRKVRRKTKDNTGGGGDPTNNGGGTADFGETLNISTINFGDNLAESQFITYGPNGDLIFNDNLFLDLEGKLGIGVKPPRAWLHVKNGSSLYPSIKIGRGPLTTVPVDGAIEFDGTNLYFTVGSTRKILGAGGSNNGGTIINNNTKITNNNIIEVYNKGDIFFNQTELTFIDVKEVYNQGNVTYNDTYITNNNITEIFNQGNVFFNQTLMNFTDVYQTFNNSDITYDNGTVINFVNGSYLQDPLLNGFVQFSDNSYTQINGQLAIPGGNQFQVLTYINGLAMWRDTSAVFNGVVSINQTFNIDNGTYFIDNGTYFETNNNYTVDNGTYNFYNSTVLVDNGYYDYTDTFISYINGSSIYNNGGITYNNGTVINFTNGSYLQDAYLNGTTTIEGNLNILGGTQFYVLTYINGSALWRAPSGDNGSYVFNNGSTVYFNQSLAFVDNIHNYFDTTINTTNNIENHSNLDVSYVDVFEQYFNGVSSYYNQSLLYEESIVNFSNTDVLFSNGSRLIIPGGVNGQVLTFVNGETLWKPSSGGTTEWTDIGNALHPADLGGNESIVIGGTTIALADIHLSNNGGAMFNKQRGIEDFVMLNAAGEEFRIEGANGNVAIRTDGLIGPSTLELSDTTQAVTFTMLPSGAASGPTLLANTLGLTIDGASSLTINVDAAARELFVNGNTVSVGATQGNATLNVDGNFALIGTATQLVTAISGITANRSYVRIAGNAGAVTITANPQITVSGTVQDGQLLILKGTSNVNTVTIVEGNGVSLESGVNFTMGSKDILQLIYDSADSEWIEISRSDK
jgi:hypothetical protein